MTTYELPNLTVEYDGDGYPNVFLNTTVFINHMGFYQDGCFYYSFDGDFYG